MVDVSGLFQQSTESAQPQTQQGSEQPNGTPAAQPTQDPYSEAFLKLARKEKEVRQKMQGAKQYQNRAQELEQELNSYKPLKENPKANVRKILDTYGLTYEDINEYILNESDLTLPPQYKEMQDEVKSLKQRIEDDKKASEQQQNQAVIDNFKREIASHVDTNGLDFIKANDAIDQVWEVIQEYYNETERSTGKGEVLDTARACEFVEKSLAEEFDKRFGNLEKVKTRFQAKPEAQNPKQPQENLYGSNSYTPSNTLNNKFNGSQSTVMDKKVSTEESLANAAKMLRFI